MKILNYSECFAKKINGLYVLQNDVHLDFGFNSYSYRFIVHKGAMTDGLSVPKIFQWYLPDWDNSNTLYNVAGIVHDAAYGSELLSKTIADQLFYEGLISAGINRFKASTAKWAVQNLAGLHYGKKHDDFGIAEYANIICI